MIAINQMIVKNEETLEILQEELNSLIQCFPNPKKDERIQIFKKRNEISLQKENHLREVVEHSLLFLNSISTSEENLSEIKEIYLILAKYCGESLSRYFKLPLGWLALGSGGGILEDLIVVLRTPKNVFPHLFCGEEIKNSPIFEIEELFNELNKVFQDQKLCDRFPFLHYFCTLNCEVDSFISNLLRLLNLQNANKRIGHFIEDQKIFLYTIQGLFGMKYSPRSVKILDYSLQLARVDEREFPLYAVHFTSRDIATKIWNCEPTISPIKNEILPVGEIIRFRNKRAIHCIGDVEKIEDHFYIGEKSRDISKRMTDNISGDRRVKYTAGLIIDLRSLFFYYSSHPLSLESEGEFSPSLSLSRVRESEVERSIFQNEIGTILIERNVPRECIVASLLSEEEVNSFWRV